MFQQPRFPRFLVFVSLTCIPGLGQKPPNNEKYKLFIYWYLCTHFGLIVPLFMG